MTRSEAGEILLAGRKVVYAPGFGGGIETVILKLSPSGSDIWRRSFGAGEPQAITTDSTGNIFVAGRSGSAGLVLARLSPSGEEVWRRSYGDFFSNYPLELAMDAKGNVVMAGTFLKAIESNAGTIPTKGDGDAFVGKLDPETGQWIWWKHIGDAGEQWANDVAVDEFGDIVTIGTFEGTIAADGFVVTAAGQTDVFCLRLDASGNTKALDRFGDTEREEGLRVEALSGGDVALTGSFQGPLNLGGETFTTTQGGSFVARRSAGGTHVWSRALLGISRVNSLAVGVDNQLVIGGVFGDSLLVEGETLTTQGKGDAFMLAYDATGKVVWRRSFGSSEEDWLEHALPLDPGEGILHVGVISGPVDLGNGPTHCKGNGPPCALLDVVP